MIKDISWDEVMERLTPIDRSGEIIYAVPKGGLCACAFLGQATLTFRPERATLIVDDIVDSGKTLDEYRKRHPQIPFFPLFDKKDYPDQWLRFPWELENGPEDSVTRLLEFIGEDTKRPGLVDTPKRVVKALGEMTQGYHAKPEAILGTAFPSPIDEMVVLKGIRFTSLCEHHMLPFSGEASVGYVPQGKVVGISKLARLVEVFSKRLQMQETITHQVAHTLMDVLKPKGVGVILRAHHSCMGCRGVNQPNAEMVTSCLLGVMLDKPSAREELLRL